MLVVALFCEPRPQGVAGCTETGVTEHGERLIQTAQQAAAALKQLILRDPARLLVKQGAAELVRRGAGVGVAGGADPRIQVVRREALRRGRSGGRRLLQRASARLCVAARRGGPLERRRQRPGG